MRIISPPRKVIVASPSMPAPGLPIKSPLMVTTAIREQLTYTWQWARWCRFLRTIVSQIAVDGFDGDSGNVGLRVAFTPASYSLTVTSNPPAGGSATIDPLPDQGGRYAPDSVVTLTATAAVGAIFTGWTGSITSTNNPLALGMNGNKSIVAAFHIIPTTKLWTGGRAQSGNSTDADDGSPSVPPA